MPALSSIEAGKQLVLIGLGGAIARLSPIKLARRGGGSRGFGGKKFAPVPAGAGCMAVDSASEPCLVTSFGVNRNAQPARWRIPPFPSRYVSEKTLVRIRRRDP